jgi:hypothetical protein
MIVASEPDYYRDKPCEACGPWLEPNEVVITVRKPGVFRKGQPKSDEERAEISRALKRRRKPEHERIKIARSMHGKRKSKKVRQRIAQSLRGRPVSPITRDRMAIAASTRNIVLGSVGGRRVVR